jgi:feruloyl esterase
MITYHGLADPLIFSRGTYHYYNTIAQGNYADTQTFYRYFPYPGNGHCGGGNAPLIDGEGLFSALVNWVENGVAPDFIVATQTTGLPPGVTTRTRKICMYPNVLIYDSGDPNNQASFHCQTQSSDPLSNTLDISPQYETSTKANTDPGPD